MGIFPGRSRYKMLVGEVFKKKGIITEDQLQEALMVQRYKSARLGRSVSLGVILVELGYAQEEQLVQAINEHYRLSVTSVSDNIEDLMAKRRKGILQKIPAPRIPIWLRLFGATTLIVALTVVPLSYVVLNRQKEQLYRQTQKIGMVTLNYFANNAPIPLLQDNVLGLNTLIKEAGHVEGLLYAVIVDDKEVIKAHTDHREIGMAFPGFGEIREARRKDEVTYFSYALPSGEQALNLTRPIVFKDRELGEVHVGISIDFIDELIRSATWSIMKMSSVLVVFGLLIALLLGYGFARPISKLVWATREISRGNYRHKVKLSRKDELGNLAKAFNQMGDELWRKALMQDSFGKYVGPEVLEMILDNPASSWLKGRRSEGTVIFTDIRGFTSYSETKEPEELVESLNEYFEIASQVILRYEGHIDKFIGDAVLGVFGVPAFREDHAETAVRAALEMQKELQEAAQRGNELLTRVGVGLNSGVLVSGNLGSQVKMEYTVVGDSVNVASRLNGLAGPGEVIISKNVYDAVADLVRVETLPPQKVKGKSEALETFKVLEMRERGDA